MKHILLFVLLFFSANTFAQDFNKRKTEKLAAFGLNASTLNTSEKDYKNLNRILKRDRKQKNYKRVGKVFLKMGIGSAILGGALLATSESGSITNIFGYSIITGGGMLCTVSVPFYLISKNRRKKRDDLIRVYNESYIPQ